MDEYIGAIKMFIGDWAPQGYMLCDGRLLQIRNYTALFAVIGNRYGGNGTTDFALPDLRGRVPLGFGAGPGLSPRNLGAAGGKESETLTIAQMPAHSHTLNGLSGGTESNTPKDNFLPEYANTAVKFYAIKDKPTDTYLPLNAQSIAPAGQGTPVEKMQPFLAVNFIICTQGIFPSRP